MKADILTSPVNCKSNTSTENEIDSNFLHPSLAGYLVKEDTKLCEAMQAMDGNGAGIVVVVDKSLICIDVLTDGDIRRSILNHIGLDEPIRRVLHNKRATGSRGPVIARIDDPPEFILLLMERFGIHQIPLTDASGRICKVARRDDLSATPRLAPGHSAVIMAGGFGSRLRPLTDTTPKPLLKVAGRPIIEHSIRRLVRYGIDRIYLTVHYRAEDIVAYFGDGSRFGTAIEYIHENAPLGTAGSVREAEPNGKPILVLNGDVVTDLDISSFFDFHRNNGGVVTVAASPYEVAVPYGVINARGSDAISLEEKPIRRFYINTGIYALSPQARERIPADTPYNMTDLIEALLPELGAVKVYAMHEYWRDIGRIEDLQRVNLEMASRIEK